MLNIVGLNPRKYATEFEKLEFMFWGPNLSLKGEVHGGSMMGCFGPLDLNP